MSLDQVGPGKKIPEEVNAIVEIPAQSAPIKYEVDKDTGAVFVDRFMATPMHYPCNYGYVPETLSEDGDPVDVLIVSPYPVMSGCVIPCRPVALLDMEDEEGPDVKVVAVPKNKLWVYYENIQDAEDLPQNVRDSIQHFFEHYKDLEAGKWVKVSGWKNRDSALKEINSSLERYKAQEKQHV